jgi:glycosylphosphatidylinositol transamidase (GPIT) subunit GPI8
MKKFTGMAIAVISLFLCSFQTTYSIEEVLSALRSGNATQLSKYFDSRVDVSLPNKSDNFSRNQAEMILKDFFANNSVKSFQVKHKGEMNGSQFCIGSLQTRNGNFRTKLYMKQKGDQQVVQEIAFQAEE